MKAILLVVVPALFCATLPLKSSAQQDSVAIDSITVDTILALEKQLIQAEISADTGTLRALLGDSYLATVQDGNLRTKADRLRNLGSGNLHYEAINQDGVRVRLYGPTAIVTGLAHGRGIIGGTRFDARLRFTHVWVREKSRWQLVGYHNTLLPDR